MAKYSENHTVYYNEKDKEVPSVTTVLKVLNKPSLMGWANYMGFKGIDINDVKEESAEFGTLIHDIIEHIVNDKKYRKPIELNKYKVYSTLNNFMTWYKQHEVKPIFTEESFSCEDYGGTVDFYGMVDGLHTIVDYKTSKDFHLTMFVQLALYTLMLELKGYQVDQAAILCVNKKEYKYKVLSRQELEKYTLFGKILVQAFYYLEDICETDKWKEFKQLLRG